MSDENSYSKREQDHYFSDMFDRMDKQDITLARIEAQTIRTNGRVSRLEWWRGTIIWCLGIIGAALITLLPYLWQYEFHTAIITNQTVVTK